jgi:hypothetical protein
MRPANKVEPIMILRYYKREPAKSSVLHIAYDCKYGKYVAGGCHGIACGHRAFIGMRGILGDEKGE